MSPFAELRKRVSDGVSGEFICVAAAVEIHVFVQDGMIAWATDSQHPFGFGKHLQESANIDAGTFREVVETCRRDRLPLGETLVDWGLVSLDQVRASLRHQIAQALIVLAEVDQAQTMFLEREYASYNQDLTFALPDFETEVPGRTRTPTRAPEPSQAQGLARQLRQTVDGIAWVEVLREGRIIDSDPAHETPRTPTQMIQGSVSCGADFAALRSAGGSLVGLMLPREQSSVWCRLEADSTFGAAVSAIWSMTAAPSERREPRTNGGVAWRITGEAPSRNDELAQFMSKAPELLAAVLLGKDGAPVSGVGSDALAQSTLLDLTRRRLPCLTLDWPAASAVDSSSLNSIGYYLRTMVTGEEQLWCYGAQLSRDSKESLWLFTDRQASQGLGWAFLTALNRTVARTGDSSEAAV